MVMVAIVAIDRPPETVIRHTDNRPVHGVQLDPLTFNSILTAFESMHYVMYTNLVERLFTVSMAIVMLLLGFGLEVIVMVVLVGSILNVVLSYLVTTRYVCVPARRVDIRGAISQFKRATPYATAGLLQTSLYSLNAVLVWQIILRVGGTVQEASEATGYYNLAFNMVVVLVSVPTVLMNALLPVISRLYHTSTDLAKLTQQKP